MLCRWVEEHPDQKAMDQQLCNQTHHSNAPKNPNLDWMAPLLWWEDKTGNCFAATFFFKKCAVHIPQKLIHLMGFGCKSTLTIKTYLRSQSMRIRYKPPIKKFQTKYQSEVPFHQTNQWNIRVKHGNSPGIIPVFFSKAVAVMNSLQF